MSAFRADPPGTRLRFAHPVDPLCRRRAAPGLLLLALSVLITGAADAGSRGPSQNFDARIEHNWSLGPLEATATTAAVPPGAALTRDPSTGAIRSIVKPTGYLTGPSPGGQDPSATALAYLNSNLALLGLSETDLAETEITDLVYSRTTGATRIYLRQLYRGLPVYGTQLQINQNRDGRILGINNAFMPNIKEAGLGRSPSPLLEADTCTAAAGLDVGIESRSGPKISRRGHGPGRRTRLVWEGTSPEPITAQLMWLPIRAGELRLVWNLQFQTAGNQNFFDFTVDASSGKVWTRFDRNRRAGYRVYERPSESPNHSTPPAPADGRVLVLDPEDPTASPAGWHFTNNTNLRGNNVDAYQDIDGDDLPPELADPPQPEPACEPDLTCDFPLDLNAPPANSIPAALANVFYWVNTVHDIQYKYGFDEAAGNFQADNFGRGGIAGDHLVAEIQDGTGNCDASFATPADGTSPRMQLFTCERLSSTRDGALDAGVIVHEYTHGLSTRLLGGPSTSSCLDNQQQMGEGWSDWYALVYTAGAGDLGPDPRTIGSYLFGQPIDGPGNRPKPYSMDPAINDFSYASINGLPAPHDLGSAWGQVLWKMYWALIDVHGFDSDLHNPVPGWAGNQRALLYVTEGMKNTICSPTFVDSRDGILQVAIDNFGGEDSCAIWRVFADFGLGTDAISGGADSTTPVNGFSLPVECQVPGNAPPSIIISSPLSGTSVPEGQLVNVAGSASDPEDGDLTASLTWTSSADGAIGSGGSFQALLSAGTHTLTAAVSDSVGVPASSSVNVNVLAPPPPEPENLPPTVTITAPANREKFRDSFPVFSGTASDPEEGDLSAKLIWTSNLDGVIGQGASLAASLSEGRHQITASVTDAGNLSASDSLARIECKDSCNAPTPPSVVGCDGVPNSGLVNDACGICGGDGSSCAGPEPGPPQAVVTLIGSTLLNRGDTATFTATVENQGSTNLSAVELSFAVTPERRIRKLTPGGLVAIGDIPPGASASQTWSGRADKQGSASITVEVFLDGVSVDVGTRELTIEK
ncbi:MAG: metalloprotease [Myxococcales bacterium]|nr:metalloprotease [Myxococcales bacterium]